MTTILEELAGVVEENHASVALFEGDLRVTYGELLARSSRLAGKLVQERGLRPGEVVGVLLPNSVEHIVSFFAVAAAGGVCFPLNINLKPRELAVMAAHARVALVITTSGLLPRWGEAFDHIPGQKKVLVDRLSWDGGSKKAAGPAQYTLYLGTSGSTARPRIVRRTEGNLLAGARNVGRRLGITGADRFLAVVPFHHANGFANCLLLPLLHGAAVVLMERFHARSMIQLLRDEAITVLFGSPFIYSVLADVTYGDSLSPGEVRHWLSSGAAMPDGLSETFRESFGIQVRQLYGSTEAGTISIQGEGGGQDVGLPLDGIDVAVLSGDAVLPAGEGEILVKSPAMCDGYVGDPTSSTALYYQDHMRTGDVGRIDAEGRLHLSARRRRVINASGVKVDPAEVEQVLRAHPRVSEALVFPVTNRRGLEVIKALVVADPRCSREEIIRHCKERLADFKVPRIMAFTDALPTDILGKLAPTEWEA
jgi:long-chain acyl-CoA synthetase